MHLTAKEFAHLYKVSVASVRKWTRQGLPHETIGKRLVRFDPDAARAWFNAQAQQQHEKTNGK